MTSNSPAAPQEGTTPPDASTFTTASTGPAITINASANPRVCGKCGGAFTFERPEIIVGDEASGHWKPRFSAHAECIDYAGNGGVSSSGTTMDEIEAIEAEFSEWKRVRTDDAFGYEIHPDRLSWLIAELRRSRASLASQTDSSLRAAESSSPTVTPPEAPNEDTARLDWLEAQMTPKDTYCEVYLAGLRRGDADASGFQVESQPMRWPTVQRDTLREAIDAARGSTSGAPTE